MQNKAINIVWLKRDLRLQDHEPLLQAEQAGLPYLILYVFEPFLIQYPDTSLRHLQFIYQSIQTLQPQLLPFKRRVEIVYAEVTQILTFINQHYSIQQLFSYRESGVQASWDRDKSVRSFCEKNGIQWLEYQRDGVLRGINNRDAWRLGSKNAENSDSKSLFGILSPALGAPLFSACCTRNSTSPLP